MERLSKTEKELVAIGAAIGSNCIPCVVYHIKEARISGLTDIQIREAVDQAAKIRKVPADRVVSSAYAHLEGTQTDSTRQSEVKSRDCGCEYT